METLPINRTYNGFEIEEERCALLVGDSGECVVRIDALESGYEGGERVRDTEVHDRIVKGLGAHDGAEVRCFLALNARNNLSLYKHCEALPKDSCKQRREGSTECDG